ncbi:MAG: serine/threonine protein kinase, partial [Kiritimatiellia bacterium]
MYAWTHSRSIHRNIKPRNIRISEEGIVKVLYLGLSVRVGREKIFRVEGTPEYMAPEQILGKWPLDCRADMYGLGATLYHMVTGRPPFVGEDPCDVMQRHLTDQAPNPRDLNPELSVAFVHLVTRLMMKAPQDRYDDWSKVLDAVQKIRAGRFVVTYQETFSRSTIAPPGTHRVGESKYALDERPAATAPEVLKPQDANGESVPVAPVQNKRGQRRTPRRIVKLRAQPARSPPVVAKSPDHRPVPRWIALPAWTLLAAWWGFLFWDLMRLPSPAPTPKLAVPTSPALETNAVSEGMSSVTPGVTELPTVREKKTPQDKLSHTQAQLTAEEQKRLDALLAEIAVLLIEDDFDAVHTILVRSRETSSSPAFKTRLVSIATFVRGLTALQDTIAGRLKDKIGHRFVACLHGTNQTVVLEAVDGRRVMGDLVAGVGTTSQVRGRASFDVSMLDPLEQSRLLGAAQTEVQRAMQFLLHMRARDYEQAETFAANCGVFSRAFEQVVKSKRSSP